MLFRKPEIQLDCWPAIIKIEHFVASVWSTVYVEEIVDFEVFDGQYHTDVYLFFKNENIILKIDLCSSQKKKSKHSYLLRLLGYKWIFNKHFLVAWMKPSNKLQKTMENNGHLWCYQSCLQFGDGGPLICFLISGARIVLQPLRLL